MSLLGKEAPGFNLQNGNFEHINLESYRDHFNVVLIFYPLAFSSVCTDELCTIRDNIKIYDSLDSKVIGISVDSLFVQKAFKIAQNINYELVSDFNKNVSKAYNSFYVDYFGMAGVSKRSAFVIDKKGIVRYEEILDKDDVLPNFKSIQNVLLNL